MVIQIVLSFCVIPVSCEQELTLQLKFDKEVYYKGEDVTITLNFIGVNNEKINSMALSIKYDNAVFEPRTKNPEDDIVNGYIPFNDKYISEDKCSLLYISPVDLTLQEGASIAEVHLKVKESAVTGSVNIELMISEILDSENNIYKVKSEILTEVFIEDSIPIATTQPVSKSRRSSNANQGQLTVETSTPQETINEIIFNDIEGHWAKEDIIFMASQGFVKGMDKYTFRPDDYITRAEFSALIVRILKLEPASYSGRFLDVAAGTWYGDIIETAAQAGIITGYLGLFRPDDYVTREEMTKMIIEAYIYRGYKIHKQNSRIVFEDEANISDWAIEYVKTAYSLGFIKGVSNHQFAPKENATRAQAVTIIRRLWNQLYG